MSKQKLRIPSFNLPKNSKDYEWERVKINCDGENIPLAAIDDIVKANCPYLKVVEDSYFVRRIVDEFGDHVYLYYAIELSRIEKKATSLHKKRKKKS